MTGFGEGGGLRAGFESAFYDVAFGVGWNGLLVVYGLSKEELKWAPGR